MNARIILTTGGYIDVFRMSDDPQRPFAKTPAGENNVMLSPSSCGPFQEENADLLTGYTAELLWRYHVGRYARRKDQKPSVAIVTEAMPRGFFRLDENLIKTRFADNWAQIVFRVKAVADGSDYRAKFIREIAPHGWM